MSNEVPIYSGTEIGSDINNYIFDEYDYDIILDTWQKILILVLNFISGGLGTLLLPFLNKRKKKIPIICAAILLAILQIFHFLHFFSLLSKVEFLEKIYNYISSDYFLESIFGNNANDEKNEKVSVIGTIIDSFEFNISETISQKSRKKFLKSIFGLISGMSYANSIFTTVVNFLNVDSGENKLLAYKIVLYSIFNPGGGILLASFALIPSCEENDTKSIVLSILSIILGLIIIICPISLSIGIFLSKLTNKMMTLFPLKITLIYIGLIGVFISFFTSGFNKRKILEVRDLIKKKEPIKPFDILYKCGELVHLYSDFGFKTFFRLIANMIIPGSGTMSLLYKYGYSCGMFRTAIIQFVLGHCLMLNAILINFGYNPIYDIILVKLFFSNEEIINSIRILNFLYTIGLHFYISGIFLILIYDYIPDIQSRRKGTSGFAYFVLNLLTGGLGTTLFGDLIFALFRRDNSILMSLLIFLIFECGGFICFGGVVFCIFFPEIANKSCKIAFPICYVFNSFLFLSLFFENNDGYSRDVSCPVKKLITKDSIYKNIKIIDDEA